MSAPCALPGRVRWLRAALSTVLIAACTLACAAEPVKVRLQLKWYHQFQFAGYYAAQAQGYYRDAGLEVELIEGGPTIAPERAVLERQAEFGIHDGAALLLSYLQGQPLSVLAAVFQHSPTVLISYARTRIRHPADLIGKSVAIGQAKAQVLALLRHEGITVKGSEASPIVRLVPTSGSLDDLRQPNVVAMSAYLSDVPRYRRASAEELALLHPRDYGVDFYGDALFTAQDYAAENAETVRRFRQASLKGWEYALANPAEIVSLIAALPSRRAQRPERLGLLEEAQASEELIQPRLIGLGHQNPERWQTMMRTFVELGFAPEPRRLDDFIFSEKRSVRSARHQHLLIAGGSVLGALCLFGAVTFTALRRKAEDAMHKTQSELAAAQLRSAALQHDTAQLTRIIDHLDSCVYMKNGTGGYLFANRATREHLFGAADVTLGEDSDALLLEPAAAATLHSNDRHILESGQSSEEEEAVSTLASARTTVLRTLRLPLRDADGQICGLCGIARIVEAPAPDSAWRAESPL